MTAPHYVGQPPPPQTERGISTGEWATAAKVTVGLSMAASVATSATSYALIRSWNGFDAGTTDFDELVAAESLYLNAGLAYFVIQVATWIAVITWLYKAAKNAEQINPMRMDNAAKWAIWGWFVPFMNLARPYHMVKETWEASDRDTAPTPESLFRTWWALFLVSGVAFRFTTGNDTPVVTILYTEIAGDVLYFAAGVLFIKIIGMIERRQATATLHPNIVRARAAAAPAMPGYVVPEVDQPR